MIYFGKNIDQRFDLNNRFKKEIMENKKKFNIISVRNFIFNFNIYL